MADKIAANGHIQVLTLYLDNQKFGVPILTIQDILQTHALTSVPLSEPYIEGVMNLRGRIVTAINLRKRIRNGQSATENQESMNIVIESDHELYSIMVDQVGEVVTLNTNKIEDPPLTLDASWRSVINGVYQEEKEIILMLDTDKIIHTDHV